MTDKEINSKLTSKQKEFVEFPQSSSNQKKYKPKHWKVWAFVIGLNFLGLFGAVYLKSKGIDVFALRGGS